MQWTHFLAKCHKNETDKFAWRWLDGIHSWKILYVTSLSNVSSDLNSLNFSLFPYKQEHNYFFTVLFIFWGYS